MTTVNDDGNKSPVCEVDRRKIKEPIQKPVTPSYELSIDPNAARTLTWGAVGGTAINIIIEYWWVPALL